MENDSHGDLSWCTQCYKRSPFILENPRVIRTNTNSLRTSLSRPFTWFSNSAQCIVGVYKTYFALHALSSSFYGNSWYIKISFLFKYIDFNQKWNKKCLTNLDTWFRNKGLIFWNCTAFKFWKIHCDADTVCF